MTSVSLARGIKRFSPMTFLRLLLEDADDLRCRYDGAATNERVHLVTRSVQLETKVSSMNLIRAVAFVTVIVGGVTAGFAQSFPPEQRFVGQFVDGSRVAADKPTDWADDTVQPKLATLPIFDAAKPLRWVIDQAQPVTAAPKAFIEFAGGDVLPGIVADYEPSQTDAFENLGEYLVVEPTVSIDLPNVAPSGFVRVSTDWVQRIVWERLAGGPKDYRPGTIFLRDGSQVRFKNIRWSKGAITLLTDDGVKSYVLAQVAELHYPQRSSWDVWFEQLAVLSPELTGRLMQVETADGMRLTSSTLRYRQQFVGDRNKPDDWFPLLQPAWSLDPIVVPFRVARSWRFFAATEPAATLFVPNATRSKPILSQGWDLRRDRSVQGTALKVNGLFFGWGFGVHAPTELDFALHPVVTAFRVQSGLDQVVKKGGSARSVIAYSNNVAAPLHRSDLLIGSEKVVDSNWLPVVAQADAGVTLKLLADPAVAERPAGGDPFDIRDCIDWLEPEWRLDPAKLKTEVAARAAKRLPSLRDWSIAGQLSLVAAEPEQPAPKPTVKLTNVWDALLPEDPHYRVDFEPTDKFVVLSRKLQIKPEHRWLALVATRQGPNLTTPTRVQVRADGVALGEAMVPERPGRMEPDPILIPVTAVRGKTVDLSVIVIAEGDKSRVDWRGAKLLAHHPGLVRIFDDEADFPEKFVEGEGPLTLSTEEKQLGSAALKLARGERMNGRLPGVSYRIRETPRLGEYRFFRFAWKKVGGDAIGMQVAHDGELGVRPDQVKRPEALSVASLKSRRPGSVDTRGAIVGYQYDIGKDSKPPQPVLRLDKKISGNWDAYLRDMFGEFGSFTVTGLGFQCPDGEAAYFDGIYLARTQADLSWLTEWNPAPAAAPTTPPDPKLIAQTSTVWEYSSLLSKVAPQFTTDLTSEPIKHLRDIYGREAVRIMPPAQGKPSILRSPLSVPVGKTTVLKLSCARHPEGDWQLAVVADGQDALRTSIDVNTAKDRWAQYEVDLTRFAGKNIVLEVHGNPTDWHYEDAFWGSVKVEVK